MFYEESLESVLRFGDILKGFIKTEPFLNKPILDLKQENEYRIHISIPEYSVVLTPCCSIGPSIVTLTPLRKIRPTFLRNPFFEEDLKRINNLVETPRNKFTPEDWEKLSPEEKLKHVEQGESYAFLNLFIYDEHKEFPQYTIKKKEIRYYMIDFTRSYHINCQNIKKDGKITEDIVESKILQLSIEAREQLRNKISKYYRRIPEEDEICIKRANNLSS